MITYVEEPPADVGQVAEGQLRAENIEPPVLARELLKFAGGEYVTGQIISLVVQSAANNPDLATQYDLDQLYYSLGQLEKSEVPGIVNVPVTVYAIRKHR